MNWLKKKFIYKIRMIDTLYKRNNNISILDIGCGNHSARQMKKLFPSCRYYGLDKQNYHNDRSDFELMEKYFNLDLAEDSLESLPDKFFDVVIMSHVIEHISNGDIVARNLGSKIKKGGIFYMEFPSARSLSFPSMKGSLHFCDDESHVRLYTLEELGNILLSNNFRIIKAGVKRDLIMIALMPALLLNAFLTKKGAGGAFWDLLGFANYITAVKK